MQNSTRALVKNNTDDEVLFQSSTIGTLKLNNKLVVAPMTRVSAQPNGNFGAMMKDYYEDFARGGFGLIITEGLYTDQFYSQGYRNQPGMTSAEQASSWKPLINSLHAKGTACIAQLMHAGALSQYNRFVDKTLAPSVVKPKAEQMPLYYGKGDYPTPQAMTTNDIKQVIQGFVDAALWAKFAGFDGVEIHGANGYLLDQFWTTYTNTRTDLYGGEMSARLRIYLEIIKGIRTAVGDDFVIGVRFSQTKVNDKQYQWPEGESAAQLAFCKMRSAQVDYIHTTEPMLNRAAFTGKASLSNLAKRFSGLPVIANGGVAEPGLASAMIRDQHSDFIALGKIALANPDWPNRVQNSAVLKRFDFAMLNPVVNLASAKQYWEQTR